MPSSGSTNRRHHKRAGCRGSGMTFALGPVSWAKQTILFSPRTRSSGGLLHGPLQTSCTRRAGDALAAHHCADATQVAAARHRISSGFETTTVERDFASVQVTPDAHLELVSVCGWDSRFPGTYAQWCDLVAQGTQHALSEGRPVGELVLNVKDFLAWCQHVAVRPGFDALRAYLILQRGGGGVLPGGDSGQKQRPSSRRRHRRPGGATFRQGLTASSGDRTCRRVPDRSYQRSATLPLVAAIAKRRCLCPPTREVGIHASVRPRRPRASPSSHGP
jgi:hypothetical protein